MVDDCIKANDIVITKTRKMLEATCSCFFSILVSGKGLFVTENLILGSPVANFMIDSYMN